jgi:hypothetical protein
VSRLLWALHHRIALSTPKSTEITAFRNVFRAIDPTSRTDEAAIEEAVTSRGYRVVYVPDALIRTNCPLTLRDYVKQRTRVTLGHLALAHEKGYGVGTLSWQRRLGALRDVWRSEGVKLTTLTLGVLLESWVYGAAWLRYRFNPAHHGIWSRSDSTKRSFSERAE